MIEYKFPYVDESSRGSNLRIVNNLSFSEDLISRLKEFQKRHLTLMFSPCSFDTQKVFGAEFTRNC